MQRKVPYIAAARATTKVRIPAMEEVIERGESVCGGIFVTIIYG